MVCTYIPPFIATYLSIYCANEFLRCTYCNYGFSRTRHSPALVMSSNSCSDTHLSVLGPDPRWHSTTAPGYPQAMYMYIPTRMYASTHTTSRNTAVHVLACVVSPQITTRDSVLLCECERSVDYCHVCHPQASPAAGRGRVPGTGKE